MPAAATTSAAAVEMLNVPELSPPVPTTSIASGGASTWLTRSRIAPANPASPATASPPPPPPRPPPPRRCAVPPPHPRPHGRRARWGRRRVAVHHGAHRRLG